MKRKSFLTSVAALPTLPYLFLGHPDAIKEEERVLNGVPKQGDPAYQSLHIDAQTDPKDVDYYFLGNGKVAVVMQHAYGAAAEAGMTPLGLMFWNPAHFCRKWSTYTFHPEWGLKRGMVSVTVAGTTYLAQAADINIARTYPDGIPTLEITWKAGAHKVTERLWVDADSPVLVREVELANGSDQTAEVKFNSSLYYNHILFTDFRSDIDKKVLRCDGYAHMELFTDPPAVLADRYLSTEAGTVAAGASISATFYYCVNTTKEEVEGISDATRRHRSSRMWKGLAQVETDNPDYNRIFSGSRDGVRSAVAEDGRYDASIWQYNMEWTQDASHVAMAAAESGQFDLAASMLTNIVTRLSNDQGVMAHASRFRFNLETELNQQGAILGALWTYWAWSGDINLIRKLWPRVRRIAEMPLKPPYLHESGLLYTSIEFFERDSSLGILPGFDLSHQAYVSWGLMKAAILAREIGDTDSAQRWDAIGKKMFDAFMNHPQWSLVEDGMFIKRRLPDGTQQKVMRPEAAGTDVLPNESPLAHQSQPLLDPDVCLLHPAVLGLIDAKDPLMAKTISSVKTLWDNDGAGGYLRYHFSADPDSPGGWTFPTGQVAKVMADYGDTADLKRILDWFSNAQGGKSVAYFEFLALTPRPVPPLPPMGIIVWGWAEIVGVFVSHILGARPDATGRQLLFRPCLPDGVNEAKGQVVHRGRTIGVQVKRGKPSASFNGRVLQRSGEAWILPEGIDGGIVQIYI